jgi:16S rRNA (uracil1498-N3)-methyltransferase
MRRFFVRPDDISGDTITISGGDAGHIGRVLRLGPGDKLSISDGVGRVYDAEIVSVERDRVICSFSNSRDYETPRIKVTLYQGLPKGKKMDLIVEKLTEVGVDRIVPVAMDRSVAEYAGERQAKKVERWRATALEAAKQSRRVTVPVVEDIKSWTDAAAELKDIVAADGPVIVPWEDAEGLTVREAIGRSAAAEEVALLIGPEGGFATQEIATLRSAGAAMVTLGPNILRTETAGIVAAALTLAALQETDSY